MQIALSNLLLYFNCFVQIAMYKLLCVNCRVKLLSVCSSCHKNCLCKCFFANWIINFHMSLSTKMILLCPLNLKYNLYALSLIQMYSRIHSRGVFQSINIQKKKMTVEEYEKHSKSDRYCTPKFTDFEVCITKAY